MAVYPYNYDNIDERRVSIFARPNFSAGPIGSFPIGDWDGNQMHWRHVGRVGDWEGCTSLVIPDGLSIKIFAGT